MPEHSVKYTKPFQNDQDEGDGAAVAVIGSNHGSATRSRRVKFVAFVVVILLILNVIFLALFLNDRHRYNECKKSLQDGVKTTPSSSTHPQSGKPTQTHTNVTSTIPTPTKPDYGPGPWKKIRLPSYFKPRHYDVELVVELDKLIFSGYVVVTLNLTQETPYMYLHSNKLKISSRCIKKNGKSLDLKRYFWYSTNQFYVMETKEKLAPGEYKVRLEFTGILADDLVGLYRSTYKNKDNKEITIAATQLQATDARKVFPCFDEPALKATFNVTLVRAKDMISLTNMPRMRSENRSDTMVADYYYKTVIMPTYLLAFVVCDFGYLHATAGKQNQTSMKYYTSKGQIDQAELARSVGGKILDYFEGFFNISYPLPKADMIAVPDFQAGAMENWGLILYRETAMLFKEGQSSESNRERIVQVISHELAHMWFGNLVTPLWWDDLWLNEGFASFVEYIGVDYIYPDWNMNDAFINNDMFYALTLDALVTSHPILLPVNHPDEINEIFDSITYNKGASVIRMLEYFLTRNTFTKGLTNYLNAYAYGNAQTKDLWNHLTQACKSEGKDIDVAEIMDTWTLQMGQDRFNAAAFPGRSDADQNNTKFTSKFEYKWNIPFSVAVGNESANKKVEVAGRKITWMNKTAVKTTVAYERWDSSNQWIKGNIGQKGFYRVNYPTKNWDLLAQQLQYNHSVFSFGDKAGLIHDAFALANAGLLEFKYALNITRYLKDERNYIPWDAAMTYFTSLARIVPKTEKAYQGIRKYRFKLIKSNFERLGFFDNGTHLDKYLRIEGVYAACLARDEVCLKKTKELFDKWINNESYPLPPDLRFLVYFYGMSQSGEKEWDKTFERLLKTNVASERIKLMYGLAGIAEPWILNRYLQYSFLENKIKSQDSSYVISYVANANPIGRQFAWNFLKESWSTILKKYGSAFGFASSTFVNSVARFFSTKWELEEVEKLFKKYPESGSATRTRDQILETIRSNIQWRKKNEKQIEEWLSSFGLA
ncbi:glutamyl aminopeptidase-like [Xenia sp. Carnegie-2017]|uniref:glutamyl aminopeptidase-like n=1 Tax=Xenia sp. Carnegie-2017 TaxID=2897299 RepID=UPI001F041BAC|nr:glutamyl aminopeptidase-like [Xenia sp. Carnegie-2017]